MLRRGLSIGSLVVFAAHVAPTARAAPPPASIADPARSLYILAQSHEDAGRTEDAQRVWRALVCRNLFPYTEPGAIVPKPQDGTVDYWRKYRDRFADPKALAKPSAETQYVEIYPDTCEPETSSDPSLVRKYLAEAWWHIGNWELEGRDVGSGVISGEPESVWGLPRAASAFRHATQFPESAAYPLALYKYATTLRRQQRYAAAARAYTELLTTQGDGAIAFQAAALSGFAITLTNPDFEGPRADAPYVARPDVLDIESPTNAEKATHVAIVRVQDPAIVHQDRSWTPALYMRLGETFGRLAFRESSMEIDITPDMHPPPPVEERCPSSSCVSEMRGPSPAYPDDTERVITDLRRKFLACFEGTATPYGVAVLLKVSPNGEVAGVTTTAAYGEPPTGARECASRALRRVSFAPPSGGSAEVALTLHFRPQ